MNDPTPSGPLLQMTGVTKQYPGCLANDHVSLTVERNQIHALLGENGAGKSTLVKIIYGVVKPDAGEIIWEGQPVTIQNPGQAQRLGIGMVFQHFSLLPRRKKGSDYGSASSRYPPNTGCRSIRTASCTTCRSANASASRSSDAFCRTPNF
jgi:ABC-type glutathione transport system ATPase component